MRSAFRLTPGADGPEAEWLDPATGRPVRGALGELPEDLRRGATILVPGEDVLVAEVEIAARQRQRLLQAIPFAVEDQLVDEVDRHHFALGPPLGGDRYLVAAVARERMDSWIAALDAARIEPARLLPDTLALPADPARPVVLLDGSRALLRHGPATALAGDLEEVAEWLAVLDAPAPLLRGAGELAAAVHPVAREDEARPALDLLLAALDDALAVDLRQGPYAPRRRGSLPGARLWLAAAALLVVAGLAQTATRALEVWADTRRARALETRTEQILRERFPDVRRIVDARVQMQQALEELRGGGSAQSDVLGLLRLAGPALAGSEAVTLEALTFRQGQLLLTVEAEDLRHIETLRQRLVAGRLDARIESANTSADRTSARIRVGGAG